MGFVGRDPANREAFVYPMFMGFKKTAEAYGASVSLKALQHMLHGASAPSASIMIRPNGVVQRRSTDLLAAQDPDTTAVLYFNTNGHPVVFNGTTPLVLETFTLSST